MNKLKLKALHSGSLRRLFLLPALLLAGIVFICMLARWGGGRAVYEIALNDANAPNGLSPSGTYLEISQLKSEETIRRALEKAGLNGVDPWKVAANLSIRASDEAAAERFSTRYIVTYRRNWEIGALSAEEMLELLLESYEETLREYDKPAPMPDWEEYAEAEYLETERFFAAETAKLLRYIDEKQTQYGSFCSKTSGETFASLKQRLRNFESFDLKNYAAFVRQSGLAKERERLIDRLENDAFLLRLTEGESEKGVRNDEFLARLKQEIAVREDEEKARQMEEKMEEKFSTIVESVNVLHLEAAGSRERELLTIIDKESEMTTALTVAARCMVLCALSVNRQFRRCISWLFAQFQKHFRWYRVCVCAAACFAGAALLWFASSTQTYIARVALRCSQEDMAQIVSTANIQEAVGSLAFFTNVDTIRSGIQINVPTSDEIELQLVLNSGYSAENARLTLDRLLNCGFLRVGKRGAKDARAVGLPDTLTNVFDADYDYIEQAEFLRDLTAKSLVLLDSSGASEDDVVFADLSDDYRFVRDEELACLFADILRTGATKDRDVLLKKYRERLEQGVGETELNEKILAKFEVPLSENTAEEQARIEREILRVQSKLQQLHPQLMEALAQNYAARGAQRMEVLSSVTVSEKLNVWVYAALAAGGVLLLGGCTELFLRRVLFLWRARKTRQQN